MISNPEIKINYYVDLVKFKEAIEVAVAANSVELLEKIKKKTTNSKTMDTIEKLIHDMTGK
jgi:biotin synthase-related radical SAM superfamily protein